MFIIDFSAVSQCDVNGAILIHELMKKLKERKASLELQNISSETQHLLDITLLSDDISADTKQQENFFSEIGRASYHAYNSVKEYLTFIGELAFTLLYALRYPSSFRMKELLRGIQEHSIKALPIVLLTSMLIGLVVAYQSALQIKKY